jgi:O-antigen ligase
VSSGAVQPLGPAPAAPRGWSPGGWSPAGAGSSLWPRGSGLAVAGLLVCVAVAAGVVHQPWLTAGAVTGGLLVMLTLARPLWVLGLMLVVGPIDLSFITGGFKAIEGIPGGLDMNGIRLVGVTLALLTVAALDPAVIRGAFSRYGRWFVVFLAYVTATLVMSDSVMDGLRLLLKLAYPFLLFIAVLGVVRTRAELERLGDWIIGAAAVIAFVLNPLFIIGGGAEITVEGRLRIPVVGVHENPFSFYMLMMILIAFARYSTRRQVGYLVLCAALALWMMTTLTRITLLAMLTGFAGIAAFGIIARRDWRTAAFAVAIATIIAIPLTPVVLERTFWYVPSAGELLGMMRDPVALFNAMNWQGREIYWAAVLSMVYTSPIIGHGLGSSTALIMATFPPEWGMVVHNEYLRLMAEAGAVGVLLLAAALWMWGLAAVRSERASADPLVREYATPAFAGLLAWGIIALTDNAFDYYASFTQYVGFMTAGALAASGLAGRVEVVEGEAPAEATVPTVAAGAGADGGAFPVGGDGEA